MDAFSITTRLTTKEYIKVLYFELYKKPLYILATFLGIYLLFNEIFKIINHSNVSIFYILCGLFLILSPTLIVNISVKKFLSNPSFQSNLIFTFNDQGFKVKGLTFDSTFLWSHILKYKETKHYLILYHQNKAGNFIEKSTLSLEQLEFIKSKIK